LLPSGIIRQKIEAENDRNVFKKICRKTMNPGMLPPDPPHC